jgi:hypothetical protein
VIWLIIDDINHTTSYIIAENKAGSGISEKSNHFQVSIKVDDNVLFCGNAAFLDDILKLTTTFYVAFVFRNKVKIEQVIGINFVKFLIFVVTCNNLQYIFNM